MRIPVLFAVFPAIAPDSRPDRTGGAKVETLPEPGPNWFLGKTWSGGAHIFDAPQWRNDGDGLAGQERPYADRQP